MTDAHETTIEKGREAWRHIQNDSHWEDWVVVGRALIIGREQAMRMARVNEPSGRGYNEAFSVFLTDHGFANMDKGDRARLFRCMDHLEDIRRWRGLLGSTQRQRLNHPSAVWRNWEKSTKLSERADTDKMTPHGNLKQEIVRLSEENERLKRRGAADETWTGNDTEDDIVSVLFEELGSRCSAQKGENIAKKLVKAFAAQRTGKPKT